MSTQLPNTYQEDIFKIIEPVFVEHFKDSHGNSPSITELKQHLVSTNTEKLIDHLKSINSRISEFYSTPELTHNIQLYIRKLK